MTESYLNKELLSEISTILSDIEETIQDIDSIQRQVHNETKIISYEETFCNSCEEPCGRSNAEIFNCMKTKINEDSTENKQYSKEYLEQDLQKTREDLQKRKQHLTKIMEKIEKGISHS
jgi:hypothetical protein